MKVFCSFCIVFARAKPRKPSQGSGFWCLVYKQIWEKMLSAAVRGGAGNGDGAPWVPTVPSMGINPPARMRAGDGSTVSPRVGTNPSKGRGCSFQRGAAVQGASGCLGTGSTRVGEILPKLVPSLAPLWSCHKGLSD